MKGYYIITTNEEPIEVVGRNARKRAIELALEIFHEHQDHGIIVQQFDDNNPDGYMAGLEFLHLQDILKEDENGKM